MENWNNSRFKTQELRLEHWGTQDEVKEMAAPVRYASNRREATIILKEIAEKGLLTSKIRTYSTLAEAHCRETG